MLRQLLPYINLVAILSLWVVVLMRKPGNNGKALDLLASTIAERCADQLTELAQSNRAILIEIRDFIKASKKE